MSSTSVSLALVASKVTVSPLVTSTVAGTMEPAAMVRATTRPAPEAAGDGGVSWSTRTMSPLAPEA